MHERKEKGEGFRKTKEQSTLWLNPYYPEHLHLQLIKGTISQLISEAVNILYICMYVHTLTTSTLVLVS
jgi:hypothetical protein